MTQLSTNCTASGRWRRIVDKSTRPEQSPARVSFDAHRLSVQGTPAWIERPQHSEHPGLAVADAPALRPPLAQIDNPPPRDFVHCGSGPARTTIFNAAICPLLSFGPRPGLGDCTARHFLPRCSGEPSHVRGEPSHVRSDGPSPPAARRWLDPSLPGRWRS